jgi:hypothetical protein
MTTIARAVARRPLSNSPTRNKSRSSAARSRKRRARDIRTTTSLTSRTICSSSAPACVDWRRIALEAWQSPSWREAAVEYHRERPPTPPRHSPDKLTASPRDIWRAAGKCIRRKAPHDALRTFLKWCDYCGVSRGAALPIFKSVVEKELAK